MPSSVLLGVYLNLHLSQYPSISSPDQVEKSEGHSVFLTLDNSVQEELKVTCSHQTFCFLLVANISYDSFDCQLVVTEPVLG